MHERYVVQISAEAASDLLAIHGFIARDSQKNAAAMLERLFVAIDALESLPHRFRVHRRADGPDHVIRSMAVPPFVVYYRVLEESATVRILTVRHGARRRPGRFEE